MPPEFRKEVFFDIETTGLASIVGRAVSIPY